MKKISFTIIISCFTLSVIAQQFEKKLTFSLPAGSKPSQIEWVDTDSDSLLEVVVADSGAHQLKLHRYTNLIDNAVSRKTVNVGDFRSGVFHATDLNYDNKVDFFISGFASSGEQSRGFLNDGQLNLQPQAALANFSVTQTIFADLNSDAVRDLLMLTGNNRYVIFRNYGGQLTPVIDSTEFFIADIAVADVDGNGFGDLVISGKNQQQQAFIKTILFNNGFKMKKVTVYPTTVAGKIAIGDLDDNAKIDLAISANNFTQIYINNDSTFAAGNMLPYSGLNGVLIADFNSDGSTDIALQGDPTRHIIRFSTGDTLSIPSSSVINSAFGDYDRDGDLDLIQVNDTLGVVLWENKILEKNIRPSVPPQLRSFYIYNRLFMAWDRAVDDHTLKLTYDVSLYAEGKKVAGGEFDIVSFNKFLVGPGANGFHHFGLFNLANISGVAAEAVDNSFLPSKSMPTTNVGFLGGGGSADCAVKYQTVSVCDDGAITLKAPDGEQALWFSFNGGYLDESADIKVKDLRSDTVFSYTPPSASHQCPIVSIYNLDRLSVDTVKTFASNIACLGFPVKLVVDAQWENVVWKKNQATAGTGNEIQVTETSSAIYVAFGNNSHGCVLQQTNDLTISDPNLQLSGTYYAITKGQSVQLTASGGASYLWMPPDGLDSSGIASPLASPLVSTTYTVTTTDSIGCQRSAQVQIDVNETGFIPTLFTPNGDGNNEMLTVLGITHASRFHLKIFNREGKMVYETTDISIASAEGWNGSVNGTQQPAGVYFWKVEGIADSGQPIRLNGKKEGSVMLIR